jgi:hypothetical protein
MEQELKWKFEGDVATEPRFALRRWFERFVSAVNDGNLALWQNSLAESLVVTDLLPEEMDRAGMENYLVRPPKQIRIPEVTVVVDDGAYHLRGTWETLRDRLMIFDGEFEMVAADVGGGQFQIFGITFSPRFRVTE